MLIKDIKYSYNDVAIVPAIKSGVEHRNDCNPYMGEYGSSNLPIFTAPMSTVVNEKNFGLFEENNIIPILPRNIGLDTRLDYLKRGKWVALGLQEFYDIFLENDWDLELNPQPHVLIDIANGHMSKLLDYIEDAKNKYGYRNIVIMAGNIANPKTYYEYSRVGCDFVRCSVGTGSGCFKDGTKVKMSDGTYKNIEDIETGEKVLTHKGNAKKVLSRLRYISYEEKIYINGIDCTSKHLFYVVDKRDRDKINDENIEDYAYWIEANKLSKDNQLLVQVSCGNEYNLIEISTIENYNEEYWVNDLTVEDDHSYTVSKNDIAVHNCITSSNTSIHYPIASLITEIYEIKKRLEQAGQFTPDIIADGGIRNYSDVIKSLALGSNYVMIGSEFAKLVESAAPTFYYGTDNESVHEISPFEHKIDAYSDHTFDIDEEYILDNLYKVFYGMASRRGQEDINGKKTKTSEGIQKTLPVTTNLRKWKENMVSYLQSAMSYTNCYYIEELNPDNVDCVLISPQTKKSINK